MTHPSYCGVGTYDELAGSCSCPITHEGARCEVHLLPTCSLGPGMSSVRPLFWLNQVTALRATANGRPPSASARRAALGPLPCGCVKELLLLTAHFRSQWVDVPDWFVCAGAADAGAADADAATMDLSRLLDIGGGGARWFAMPAPFEPRTRTYAFANQSQFRQIARAEAEDAFGARLLPLHQCPQRCGRMGFCMQGRAESVGWGAFNRASPRCQCFPEAVHDATRRSCVRLDYVAPLPSRLGRPAAAASTSAPSTARTAAAASSSTRSAFASTLSVHAELQVGERSWASIWQMHASAHHGARALSHRWASARGLPSGTAARRTRRRSTVSFLCGKRRALRCGTAADCH